MYKHSGKPEASPHRVLLSIGESILAKASAASYTYVYLHEHCHAIHFQLLHEQPNLNAQWVKMFTTTVSSRNLGSARLAELGKAVIGFEGSVKDFMKSSEVEVQADVKLIFRWLHENRNLSHKEVEVLKTSKSASAKETLESVWPTSSVRSKKLKPLVTEYATRNFRELFAEACSLYIMGKELPANVVSLVEKSLTLANQLAVSK
jgi:hypothetical protein